MVFDAALLGYSTTSSLRWSGYSLYLCLFNALVKQQLQPKVIQLIGGHMQAWCMLSVGQNISADGLSQVQFIGLQDLMPK